MKLSLSDVHLNLALWQEYSVALTLPQKLLQVDSNRCQLALLFAFLLQLTTWT